jgi:hypothetical protein
MASRTVFVKLYVVAAVTTYILKNTLTLLTKSVSFITQFTVNLFVPETVHPAINIIKHKL